MSSRGPERSCGDLQDALSAGGCKCSLPDGKRNLENKLLEQKNLESKIDLRIVFYGCKPKIMEWLGNTQPTLSVRHPPVSEPSLNTPLIWHPSNLGTIQILNVLMKKQTAIFFSCTKQ